MQQIILFDYNANAASSGPRSACISTGATIYNTYGGLGTIGA